MKRIVLVDILRGIAILGTLGTNIWIFANLGDLKYITTTDFTSWSSMDDMIRIFVLFIVNDYVWCRDGDKISAVHPVQ